MCWRETKRRMNARVSSTWFHSSVCRERNLFVMCIVSDEGLSYLFLRHPPLDFTTDMYGYYRAVGWAVRGVCLSVVIPVCDRVLRVTETQFMVLGLVSAEASLMILGSSQYTWMPFVGESSCTMPRSHLIICGTAAHSRVIKKTQHGYFKTS